MLCLHRTYLHFVRSHSLYGKQTCLVFVVSLEKHLRQWTGIGWRTGKGRTGKQIHPLSHNWNTEEERKRANEAVWYLSTQPETNIHLGAPVPTRTEQDVPVPSVGTGLRAEAGGRGRKTINSLSWHRRGHCKQCFSLYSSCCIHRLERAGMTIWKILART